MERVDTDIDIGEIVEVTFPEVNRLKALIKTLKRNRKNRQSTNPSLLNITISSIEEINLVKIIASMRLVKLIKLRFANEQLQREALDILLIRDLKLNIHARQYMVSTSLNRIHLRDPNASINNDTVKALQHEFIMGFITCIDYYNQSDKSSIPPDIMQKIKNNMIISE